MIPLAWTCGWRPWEASDVDKAQMFGVVSIRVNGQVVMTTPMPPWATALQAEPTTQEISNAAIQFLIETLVSVAAIANQNWT